MAELEVMAADVTQLEVDAIANAANTMLLHGGALASDSRCTSGPPAREIAPATPPPWRSWVLAAFAIASTSSAVTSAAMTSSSATAHILAQDLSISPAPVRG